MLEALGGKRAWDATRYLRFDFVVEKDGKRLGARAHTWDKWTGRYRLQSKTEAGEDTVVLMNLNTREGSAHRAGSKLAGRTSSKELEQAYATWINDTYWLLMPFKLRDPGVVLGDGGTEMRDGVAWDKLVVAFESVGLTPKDKYWVWVNRETGLVDRWDYLLQGAQPPPKSFLWRGWAEYGGIRLAGERQGLDDGLTISFPVLEVPADLPDAVFTSP